VRLEYFLELLPSWVSTAVEFRHPSWHLGSAVEGHNWYTEAACEQGEHR
jgi:uncharacterized protein YecE (DUF72 family)